VIGRIVGRSEVRHPGPAGVLSSSPPRARAGRARLRPCVRLGSVLEGIGRPDPSGRRQSRRPSHRASRRIQFTRNSRARPARRASLTAKRRCRRRGSPESDWMHCRRMARHAAGVARGSPRPGGEPGRPGGDGAERRPRPRGRRPQPRSGFGRRTLPADTSGRVVPLHTEEKSSGA
jgi:hypothetical protein